MTEHRTFRAGLKNCPLCGTKVKLKAEGKLFMSAPGEELPVWTVRGLIRCPNDYLRLDLAAEGYADPATPEDKQRTVLASLMETHAKTMKEIWNRRET